MNKREVSELRTEMLSWADFASMRKTLDHEFDGLFKGANEADLKAKKVVWDLANKYFMLEVRRKFLVYVDKKEQEKKEGI